MCFGERIACYGKTDLAKLVSWMRVFHEVNPQVCNAGFLLCTGDTVFSACVCLKVISKSIRKKKLFLKAGILLVRVLFRNEATNFSTFFVAMDETTNNNNSNNDNCTLFPWLTNSGLSDQLQTCIFIYHF